MKKIIFLLFLGILLAPALVFASFDTNLGYSSIGQLVTELQKFLQAQGVYDGPITGNFYSLTLNGVKAFQTQEGISPVSGFFGPLTRARANELLSKSISLGENVLSAATSNEAPTQKLLATLFRQLKVLQGRVEQLQQQNALSHKLLQQQGQINQQFNQIVPSTTPPPPPEEEPSVPEDEFLLTVSISGSGAGNVTSSPAGINCGTNCTAEFEKGTNVILSANSGPSSIFTGWRGDCSGASGSTDIVLEITSDKSVIAQFEDVVSSNSEDIISIQLGPYYHDWFDINLFNPSSDLIKLPIRLLEGFSVSSCDYTTEDIDRVYISTNPYDSGVRAEGGGWWEMDSNDWKGFGIIPRNLEEFKFKHAGTFNITIWDFGIQWSNNESLDDPKIIVDGTGSNPLPITYTLKIDDEGHILRCTSRNPSQPADESCTNWEL